jgi:hypothetical protein
MGGSAGGICLLTCDLTCLELLSTISVSYLWGYDRRALGNSRLRSKDSIAKHMHNPFANVLYSLQCMTGNDLHGP